MADKNIFIPLKNSDSVSLKNSQNNSQSSWLDIDNKQVEELAVDIYESDHNITIKTVLAGVLPENIDIVLRNDMLTIKGRRVDNENAKDAYLHNECYWGNVSRSIILPCSTHLEQAVAVLARGVLTITLPKNNQSSNFNISVYEDDN